MKTQEENWCDYCDRYHYPPLPDCILHREAEAISEVLDVATRFEGGLTQKEEDAIKMLKEKYW